MSEYFIQNSKENTTVKFNEIFQNIDKDDTAEIIFEYGTYYFDEDGTTPVDFGSCMTFNGERKVVFDFEKCNDLIIKGNGSTFVFGDTCFPFYIKDCLSVSLNDINIDFVHNGFYEGKISSSNMKGFVVDIDPLKFNYCVLSNDVLFKVGNVIHKASNHKLLVKSIDYPQKAFYLVLKDYEYDTEFLNFPVITVSVSDADEGIKFNYSNVPDELCFAVGERIIIVDGDEVKSNIIYADNVGSLLIDNVNIYNSLGNVVACQMCTDVTIDGLKVLPKSGKSESYCVFGDIVSLAHCDGVVSITNCRFDSCMRDAIHIFGVYTRIEEIISKNELRLSFPNKCHQGIIPYLFEDVIEVYDHDMRDIGEFYVSEVRLAEDGKSLIAVFEEDIGNSVDIGFLVENPQRSPEIRISDNEFFNCMNIRLFSKKNISFNDNVVDINGSLIFNDLHNYESGTIDSAEIRNNKFVCDHVAIIAISESESMYSKPHNRVEIEKNSFITTNAEAINLENVNAEVVKLNVFRAVSF